MTTTTDPLVREQVAGTARGRWLMLIVLLAGQFMALLDIKVCCQLRADLHYLTWAKVTPHQTEHGRGQGLGG